jgi:hypothetical protein
VDCSAAPGLPLAKLDGVLSGALLTEHEREQLNAVPGSVVLVGGGIARLLEPSAGVEVDPADWLDASGWTAVRAASLGAASARPASSGDPRPFDARSRAGLPGESAEHAAILNALRTAGNRTGVAGAGAGTGGWLSRLLGSKSGHAIQGAERARGGFMEQARWFAARMSAITGWSRVIGRRQAEYIGRMMEMFERGSLAEALRHAIPMGEIDGTPKPPALGGLWPRADLTINPRQTTASSSVHLLGDLTTHLNELYRKAARKLEEEGRIDEAAFVLAELLGANEEAVHFLEKHGRYRLAAEIAEARGLAPGIVVRAWFLAGDVDRAVLIARRTGAFADAVMRLERTDAERASRLRTHWAFSLGAAGDYPGAINALNRDLDVVLIDPALAEHARSWIDATLALGGPAAARLLARMSAIESDLTAVRASALALLDDDRAESADERRAFAAAIADTPASPQSAMLARESARALLRDAGLGSDVVDVVAWQRLIRACDDPAFSADLPHYVQRDRRDAADAPMMPVYAPGDAGSMPVYDAAFLPGGRMIAALGEAGLRLISREGRTITHVDQPAHRIIVSDTGSRVIALAPRGDVWRAFRFDLASRKAMVWTDATLRAFAPTYDGSLWFAAMDDEIHAIDAIAEGFKSLWRLPKLPGKVEQIARNPRHCSFLLFSVGVTDEWGRPTELWTRLERWTLTVPSLVLSERNEMHIPAPPAAERADYIRSVAPDGSLTYVQFEPDSIEEPEGPGMLALTVSRTINSPPQRHEIGLQSTRPALQSAEASNEFLVLVTGHDSGTVVRVLRRGTMAPIGEILLQSASRVCTRQIDQMLTVADDRGRLLTFDLDRRRVIRDLRIT